MQLLRDIRRLDSTALVLILANLVPLYGVFALDWAVFPILFLFWFENVVIGFFNAARMLSARPTEPVLWAGKLFLVAFFCVHYGMFTAVHGGLVLSLFGGVESEADALPDPALVTDIIAAEHLLLPVLALVASHGYSFVVNFLLRGEYRNVSPKALMARPYRRIVLLHVTILAGGALVTALDAPVAGLVLLIALKIAMDLQSHLRTHAKEQQVPPD
ncbi:MAG: hypothetical protein GVY21_07400 [Gammaproteobacteria bacterium]|jgi:hypothetical protein|nr:hypothetical protein [Gammaproteobacteria bacterium]